MKSEIWDKLGALITAAFGLVAALAWNGAIRAIFERIFGTADNITAMLVYAIIVTVIAVLVTLRIAKVISKAKGES
jgi:hypothetical protein